VVDPLSQRRAAQIGLVITRLFDAPPDRVWLEWTDASRFAQWFGGAEVEVPLSTVVLDLVVGGTWTATTRSRGPDRRERRWRGEYVEIVPPERLVFTINGPHGVKQPDLVTVSLTPVGEGRTEMVLRQQGQGTPEQYELGRDLWARELDQIARRLADTDPPQPQG
jgi:uncharacterized protein YndB with AHSA1/START domain